VRECDASDDVCALRFVTVNNTSAVMFVLVSDVCALRWVTVT